MLYSVQKHADVTYKKKPRLSRKRFYVMFDLQHDIQLYILCYRLPQTSLNLYIFVSFGWGENRVDIT